MKPMVLVLVLMLMLAGCSARSASTDSSPATVGQATPSPSSTPEPKNVAEISGKFTETTDSGYTADVAMKVAISPFTKSIVDATPGHTNVNATVISSATAVNTTTGRQNPDTFRADGWIAYLTNSPACLSDIAQMFTHLHTKNGRYCLFETASFFFGPFDPGATYSVDSSKSPELKLGFRNVADADVPGVIAAASQPAAVILANEKAADCTIFGDRDVLTKMDGGYEPLTIKAFVVNGVTCGELTAP